MKSKREKQFIAGLKAKITTAESNASYYQRVAERRAEDITSVRVNAENRDKANAAAYQAEISRLNNLLSERSSQKQNEDARINALVNSLVQTAIATTAGRRA